MSLRKKPSERSQVRHRVQKGIIKIFWDQLNSMQFAIILLIIVLIASVIGVLLPQPASINPNKIISELRKYDREKQLELGKSIRKFKDQDEEEEFILRLNMGDLSESDILKLMYIDKYGKVFSRVLLALSFHHLFSAWWYYLLLSLLMLSLTICSFNRLPGYIRQSFSRNKLENPKSFKRFKPNRVIPLPMSSKSASERLSLILKGENFNVLQEEISQDDSKPNNESNGTYTAYADKGGFGKIGMIPFVSYVNGLGRFGPFLTHISVVIILLGGLTSSLMSFSHFQLVRSGDVISIPKADFRAKPGYPIRLLRRKVSGWVGSLATLLFEENSNNSQASDPENSNAKSQRSPNGWITKIRKIFEVDPYPGETLLESRDWRRLKSHKTEEDIAFKVKFGDLKTSESPDGTPREYKTWATVLDPDEVYTHIIEVNRPLVYKGFYFYQSTMPTSVSSTTVKHVTIRVSKRDKNGKLDFSKEITVPFKKIMPVPGTDLSIKVDRFWCDFNINMQTHRPSNRSNQHNNPAVHILVYKDGKPDGKQYLFLNYPNMHTQRRKDGYVFTMMDYEKDISIMSGLTIRTHPAMNLVWIGCTTMMIGMVLSFYFNHRRIWALIEPTGEGRCCLHIMGNAFRWQEDFSRKFGETCDLLAKSDPINKNTPAKES